MWKVRSCVVILFAAVMGTLLLAQDTKYSPQGEQIPGPANPTATSDHCCAVGGERAISVADWKAWLKDVRHWRMST